MATYNDIVTDILTELGVLASGETAEPNDAALVLKRVNMLRDSWNAERLMVYEVREETFTLIVDQQAYTLGAVAADFVTTRPVKIEAGCIIDATSSPSLRYPMTPADHDRWISRAWDESDEFPSEFYYETSYPLGILHLSDIPTTAHTLELSTWQPWTTALVLGDTVSLPPAYYALVLYNGALRSADAFGKEPSATLKEFARESRATVKSLNSISPKRTSDVPRGLSR